MRVVLLAANGAFALPSAQALAEHHDLSAVIRPAGTWRARAHRITPMFARWSRQDRDPLSEWLRGAGVRQIMATRKDASLASVIRALSPDVICIVTFPWLLDDEVLNVPNVGVVNAHPSLLPRHRGANPYFWVYYHGDATTGATIHQAVPQADSGPILAQESFALDRGTPLIDLHDRTARATGPLVITAIDRLSDDHFELVEQDEQSGTLAPRVSSGTRMVDFDQWSAAHVWHFLRGMHPFFQEPLVDDRGRVVKYAGVGDYELCSPPAPAPTVRVADSGWDLCCRDGVVRLLHTAADG